MPPDKSDPHIHVNDRGYRKAQVQCMTIDTNGNHHKRLRKAVAMEEFPGEDGDSLRNKFIKDFFNQDPLKELQEMYRDSDLQESRRFYLNGIKELFTSSRTRGGGMDIHIPYIQVEGKIRKFKLD